MQLLSPVVGRRQCGAIVEQVLALRLKAQHCEVTHVQSLARVLVCCWVMTSYSPPALDPFPL